LLPAAPARAAVIPERGEELADPAISHCGCRLRLARAPGIV
jgi:hypothetical protein